MAKARGADFDRKFDEWEWHDRTVTKETFHFEVRYKTPENIAQKLPTFYITSNNPPISIEDGSITELRNKLDKAIRDHFVRKWEKRLVVKYAKSNATGHAELSVDVTVYEIDTTGSSHVYRQVYDRDFHVKDEGKDRSSSWSFGSVTIVPPQFEGGIEESIVKDCRKYGEDDAEIVILHDTPINRSALVAMIEATQVLGSRLAELLSANAIKDTLVKVSRGLLALPAVSTTKKGA